MADAGFTHAAGADIPHSATSWRGMLPALAGLVVGLASTLWTTLPRSYWIPAAADSTGRNVWRPRPTSRWNGSPGSTGTTPATTCATPADSGRFRQMLRPACRRCTARRGITGPIACRLPPHQTVCRRHRLWTGPAARTHAGQLDVSPFPEILCAQRRHLAQLRDHPWHDVAAAAGAATRAIYQALRDGIWIPGQRQRLRQLAPGTWDHALTSVLGNHGRQDDDPGRSVIEVAIYPEVVWLAARSLRRHSTGHRAAS
jgi:hypothetical protein